MMRRRLTGLLAPLASALLAGALIGDPAGSAEPVPIPPAENRAFARDVLEHLIAINSTHAFGSTAAAQYIAATLRTAGFADSDIEVLAPEQYPTKGNVVVRLHGRNKAKALLYLCHLDVVEAKREDWSFDPFTLTERDGWLYGRGTIDMKGQDAAIIATLVRLKTEGYRADRDIVVAFTADEEAGGDANGVQWLLKAHRASLDAGLIVNPDGGEAAIKAGRKLYVGVQTSEKVFLTFGLETTDKGGHSSRPTASNPIYRLSRGLDRLALHVFPAHLTETTKLYFARRAELASGQSQADLRAVSLDPPDPGALARLSADVETNIMLRTTCVTTMIEGGHAENALPQRARATVQCRLIPGETQSEVARAVAGAIDDPAIVVSVVTPAVPSPDSAPRPAILATVAGVVRSMWPGVIVLPEMSPGADDSIHVRKLGIPAYGIDGMFDDLDDGRAHGRDERIGVAAFDQEVEFSYRLMKALGSDRTGP